MGVSEKSEVVEKVIKILSKTFYNYYIKRKFKKRVHSIMEDTSTSTSFNKFTKEILKANVVSQLVLGLNVIDYCFNNQIHVSNYYKFAKYNDNISTFVKSNNKLRDRITEDTLYRLSNAINNAVPVTEEVLIILINTFQLFLSSVPTTHLLYNDVVEADNAAKELRINQKRLFKDVS